MLLNVLGEGSAKELWDKLEISYRFKSLVNKLFLQKKSYHLGMNDDNSLTNHLNAFNIGELVSFCWY